MNQPTGDRHDLARLVALAERLAAEGQMNLNKTVEAIIYSKVRRAGWHYRPQVTLAQMHAELTRSILALKQDGTAPEIIAVLELGEQGLEKRGGDDLLAHEAPDVFVCRTCGYMALDSAPEHCPDCGAWPGRFRKFVSLFNGDNAEPTNPLVVLAQLASNAEALEAVLDGLSDDQMLRQLPGSDWAIRHHVAHFYDTQDLLDTRIDLMLRRVNPELKALALYEQATQSERHPASTRAILGAFREKRARCIARLEALPLKDWWRTGWHPEFGQMTVLRQAAYSANHEQTHLPDVEALRRAITS
jgi:rubrerythrin